MHGRFGLKIREQFTVSAFSLTIWQTSLHILINVHWNKYATNDCCLLFFGVTNNRVYNDAFRTFTFSMQKSVSYTYQLPYDQTIRIILLILDFKLRTVDNRKDYLLTWGEFFFFIIIIILFYKNWNTGSSSKHLLLLQKFCMNSRYKTGNFWIQ
jgi:hypothetical protein